MNHFFDIGANVGQVFPNYLASRPQYDGWRVWCFEPSALNIPGLLHTIEGYRSRYEIIVCPCAITGKFTFQNIHRTKERVSDSLYFQNGTPDPTALAQFAAGVPLTDILRTYTLPGDRVVVSIDAEGSEYDILASLLTERGLVDRIIKMFVEWHKSGNAHLQGVLIDAFASMGRPLENNEY